NVTVPAPGEIAAPTGGEREWFFPNLMVQYGETQPGMPVKQLHGGANYRLEKTEVDTIKRETANELRLKHPHFGDGVAPYLLLWLAPIAGIIDLGRHVWVWLHVRDVLIAWLARVA